MKNRVLLSMFALLGLMACSSSDMDQVVIPENGQPEVVIPTGDDLFELTATTLSEEESRAGFTDGNKTQTVWHKGDQVKLTSKAGASAVLTNELEQGNSAFFRGTGTEAAEIDTYYAVYPASETLSNEGVVTLNFATQDGTEKSAIKAAGWCESVTKNEITMDFKPINSLLYVTVSNLPAGYTIYEVKFTDLDGNLPSKQTYNIATGNYTNGATDAAYYSISTSSTSFFISLPAGYTPATGYVLTIKAKDGAGAEQCTVGAFGANGGFKAGTTSRVTFDWTKNGITTVGPKTSYDLYLERNSGANAENSGQTVYCDQYFPTTYNMQNTLITKGFIQSVGYTYDGGEFDCAGWWDKTNKQFHFESNLGGQAKQAHSVVAWLKTKHNDYIVAYKTLHVTGIPYSANFYDTTSTPSEWTIGGTTTWKGYGLNAGDGANYLRLRGHKDASSRGYAISPAFYLPESSLSVKTTLDCYYYRSSGNAISVYVNPCAGTMPTATSNATSLNGGVNFNNFDKVNDVTNVLTVTSANNRIGITHNVPNEGITTKFLGVKKFTVAYNL